MVSVETGQYFEWIQLFTAYKERMVSTSYLLPLASTTSFTECYEKPSRAPTLTCLSCCAIPSCSEVGTSNQNFVSEESLDYKLNILAISGHKSRVGARKARQWACPRLSRFTSVVCGQVKQMNVERKINAFSVRESCRLQLNESIQQLEKPTAI